MSKVIHIRYSIDMAKIDEIYAAVDDFGLITSKEATALGVPNAELVQQARRGKLRKVGRGVYQMPIWPYQEALPYAIAVKSAGEGAFLYGETVIALLNLAPTNPSRMTIGVTSRTRRNLGKNIMLKKVPAQTEIAYYEGIPSQPVVEAILAALPAIGRERGLMAAEEAARQGYLTTKEKDALCEELSR